ncbi:MAG: GTPase Era [Chitinispirillaceae bacterium]|nr:GTPase Era [Chitinispirillaceae bacterium]
MTKTEALRSGFIALAGRPNSGKSALLNTVIGMDLAVVTALPQTTRQTMRGIYTSASLQLVFIDTPGIHAGKHAINEAMLREARTALEGARVDCICYLVDLTRDYGREEALVAGLVTGARSPVLLIFNKADRCPQPAEKRDLFFGRFPGLQQNASIILSAIQPSSKETFLRAVDPFIKEGPLYFDADELTDAPMRFFAAEFLRKHIILNTRQEVPHAAFVEIEQYREREGRHVISAAIHVETGGQKGIIIGAGGGTLGTIRTGAQNELSRLAGCPVRISCHVKVTPGWRDNKRFLREHFLP